jgi:uncharacterized protein with von Willebrand factor type A (vWA) domain
MSCWPRTAPYTPRSSGKASVECLNFIAQSFPRSVWLNPKPAAIWDYTRSIIAIRRIFPMFELTIDGLEQAVTHLMQNMTS